MLHETLVEIDISESKEREINSSLDYRDLASPDIVAQRERWNRENAARAQILGAIAVEDFVQLTIYQIDSVSITFD